MKGLKKLFSFLGISLVLALSQGNAYAEKPIKIVPNLYSNKDHAVREICYKDEKSFVGDLEKSLDLSKYEHIAVFLPDSNKAIDLTDKAYNEKVGKAVMNVSFLDENYFHQLMTKENKLIEYHTHPKNLPIKEIKKESSLIFKGLCKEKPQIARLNKKKKTKLYQMLYAEVLEDYLSKSALPTSDDFIKLVYETVSYSELNPNGHMNFRLCSESGICTYSLTQKGINLFNSRKGEEYFGQWIAKKDKNRLYLDLDPKETCKERTIKFASMLSDSLLDINFKTYEEFYSQ